MSVFMGNRRVCNCGDTLNDPYAYPLLVRVTDSVGNGMNGETLRVSADFGLFEQGYNNFNTVTDSNQYMEGEEWYNGVALGDLHYVFPTVSSDVIITVKAKLPGSGDPPDFWKEIFIKEQCFVDGEFSGLTPPTCHETIDPDTSKELPGDGYDDGSGQKTIKLEVDYDDDYGYMFIEKLLDTLEPIMNTAHIQLGSSFASDIINLPDSISKDSIRAYLAQYRNTDDHIHILLATRRSDDSTYTYLGDAVDYNLAEWGHYSHTQCAHLASTDSAISQAHLDSTGIVIYGDVITSTWIHLDTLLHPTFNLYRMHAVVFAHEIGHALGLYSHHGEGVMMASFDFSISGNGYEAYNFFDTTSLNISPPSDVMNTRDVLGIHTLDIHW